MKHARKALAVLLSLSLTAGLPALAAEGAPAAATPPTVTSGLTDFASVRHQDAVAALMQLGLVSGIQQADGTHAYQPDASIDRASMAKLVSMAVTLTDEEDISGTTSFTDISSSWAKDYIQFCADKGILAGAGDGTFNPTGTVTGQQTAKMLLAAMGVEGLTGADWAQNTDAAAQAAGLYDGIDADMTAPLTRDDAAQLICNALTASDGSQELPKLTVVEQTTALDQLTLVDNQVLLAPEGKLLTLTVDGEEKALDAGSYANATLTVTDVFTQDALGSWNALTGLEYRAALRVVDGAVDTANSVLAGLGGDASADGLTLTSGSAGFSALVVEDSDYTLTGADILMDSDSDGRGVNDFAGLGAAVAVYGDSTVVIEDSEIATAGVAKAATFADSGSDLIVRGSTLSCDGGTIYPAYKSTANQALMINPPWVLGISGSARTTNVMGEQTTGTYVDTTISAADWGAVSIDTGSYMHLTLINSVVEVLGSGYGAYAIGDGTIEDYYGTSFDVETYAAIMTGATVNLNSVEEGQQIEVRKVVADDDPDNHSLSSATGELVTTETATATANTTIQSDNFGFMFHHNAGDGWNVLNVNAGTVLETGHAAFLVKKVNAEINVDDATIETGDGVILQMIDNDDDMVGAYMDDEFGMPTFNMSFTEPDGWSSTWGVEYKSSGWQTDFTVTDTALTGNLYNGTGYTANGGQTLNVTLGEGASLTGTISATEIQHGYSEDQLNKSFTYRYDSYDQATAAAAADKLGHVVNQNYSNGVNLVNVTLEAGSTWTVTAEGIINSLTIADGATFNGTYTQNADGTITVAPLN